MENDPVVLFERTANDAVAVAAEVDPSQFVEHMAGGGAFMGQLLHTWDLAVASGAMGRHR